MADSSVRIDKYLWAVRLFKTRSIAAEACKKGKVSMNGMTVKSSRVIKAGDEIDIRIPPITRRFKVLDVAEKRMGAKLTPDFVKDITPPDQLEMLELARLASSANRDRGMGRPTKKDRRDLEKLQEGDWDF
ncbi:RNA-binding S4 domain-containing protein [Carboxylicivirga sp. A043]|uniref:RNA-binding S4 domain-containing protein n=1 Tax=Carboxylicivirga litoralis TaxID=2816963 RepID=UPI0021CB27A5|nr:RNA-binding S4 domain-containing protein [Carboxylicivirga sp. A043]MCU4154793.1 RNA-binding S4 domain-containing protein [Carboxylicivirga sp. A043]